MDTAGERHMMVGVMVVGRIDVVALVCVSSI